MIQLWVVDICFEWGSMGYVWVGTSYIGLDLHNVCILNLLDCFGRRVNVKDVIFLKPKYLEIL